LTSQERYCEEALVVGMMEWRSQLFMNGMIKMPV
jgi:hypothetical protein